jgi:cysteine synthase A
MIIETPLDFVPPNILIRANVFARKDVSFYLKTEIFNPAGSIKFKPAIGIINDLETKKILKPGSEIIDTTSGNMGIALSIVARARAYPFTCVSDDKVTAHNRALLEAYGTKLIILPGSTLKERYRYIETLLQMRPSLVWTQQFTNQTNPDTHQRTTARELLDDLPDVTHIFVGTGTAGTLVGLAQALKNHPGSVELIAVDAEGSVHFDPLQNGKRRLLPGIGATERSPFLAGHKLHDVVIIPEGEAIAACHDFARRTGWLFGGSSGSVIAAIHRSQHRFKKGSVVVGIAADSGERYLDSLYNSEWINQHFTSMPESKDLVQAV